LRSLIAMKALVLAALLAACAVHRSDLRTSTQDGSLEAVFDRVHTSVVTIYTLGRTGLVDESGQAATASGVGSGVLISDDGKIMTAAHVVQTADAVRVEFDGGTILPARVVGSSPLGDVALIQLERQVPADAFVAPLGDSGQVRVANQVFVVGAPLGIGQTLTVGHISARRMGEGLGGAMNVEVFQTDAAINKGNSGGPLFNMKGEVIGIVSYIVSKSGGNEGLGFAVTSNTARELLLERNPMWSGMQTLPLAGPFAAAFNIPGGTPGLLVQTVAKDSPGERLGLKGGSLPASIGDQKLLIGGDIIIEGFGIPLVDEASLVRIMKEVAAIEASDTITLKVLRAGEVVCLQGKVGELMPWIRE